MEVPDNFLSGEEYSEKKSIEWTVTEQLKWTSYISILQRNQQDMYRDLRETERERLIGIYFKELAYMTVEAGKSKIWRIGRQAEGKSHSMRLKAVY